MKSTDATPAVLLHGFAQNRNCWGLLADELAAKRPVVPLDLPGHGTAAEVRADLWQSGQFVLDGAPEGRFSLVGYSMGGRTALHAALLDPARIAKLVLISATAGLDAEEDRAARRAADEALADRIEADGVDAFIDRWLANPLFAGLTDETRFVDERRTNTAEGLASSLRLTGTGTQEPLWDRLGELTMPTLIVCGELDTKFVGIAERLAATIPGSMLTVIGTSGHSPHLEQPAATAEVIGTWLEV